MPYYKNSDPTLDEDNVYYTTINTPRKLVSINRKSGKKIWEVSATIYGSTPIIANGRIYINSSQDGVFVYNSSDGQFITKINTGLYFQGAIILKINNRIYYSSDSPMVQ
jgi:outer membrane protein assembly factor BamB